MMVRDSSIRVLYLYLLNNHDRRHFVTCIVAVSRSCC